MEGANDSLIPLTQARPRGGHGPGFVTIIVVCVAVGLAVAALVGYGIYTMMGGGGGGAGSVWGTKLGLTRTGSGRLVLRVLMCPGEQVRAVKLAESDSAFSSAGPTLWSIQSAAHSAAQFVIGSAPAGFVTTKAFTGEPGPRQPLILDVTTHGDGGAFEIDFMGSEVRSGSIYVAGPGFLGTRVHVTAGKFSSVRGELCRLQPNGPGG